MEFVYSVIAFSLPLWFVFVIFLTLLVSAYFAFTFAIQGFIPILQRASETIIKNNQKELDDYFSKTDKQIKHIDKRLDVLMSKYESEVLGGYQSLEKFHSSMTTALNILIESVESVHQRAAGIKALESEIIKMKQIIKRKSNV